MNDSLYYKNIISKLLVLKITLDWMACFIEQNWFADTKICSWCKTWEKLCSSRVNFINILCSSFLYKNALPSFSLDTIWFGKFFGKRISAKSWSKMLMRFTPRIYTIGYRIIKYYSIAFQIYQPTYIFRLRNGSSFLKF